MSGPDIAPVDCGACRACCKRQLITLQPGEDPSAYDCHTIEGPAGNLYALRHKPNGDCVYLGPDGCVIYGRHPIICRVFDCVAFAAAWPRARRREAGMKGKDEVFKAGLARLHRRTW